MIDGNSFDANPAERLALDFFARVWAAPHDLEAIDELMTEDYVITSGGTVVRGRAAFKAWVREFQTRLLDAHNQTVEVFANAAGDRVVSRWICRGRNNGMLGLPADGRPVEFSGIAIWAVRDGRLAECWVERSAWELYRELSAEPARSALDQPVNGVSPTAGLALRTLGGSITMAGGALLFAAFGAATHGALVWGSARWTLPIIATPFLVIGGVAALYGGAFMRRAGRRAEPGVLPATETRGSTPR